MSKANRTKPASRRSGGRRLLRRRILLGNAFIGLLLLIAAAIVAIQVGRLVSAIETLNVAHGHVDSAHEIRHTTTTLYSTVTRLLAEEDAGAFTREVTPMVDELRAAQSNLVAIAEVTEDPATVEALGRVNDRVTSVVNIVQTMVRQAEINQWSSVRLRLSVLNRDQQAVLDAVDELIGVVHHIEEDAALQVASAERAVIFYPSVVGVVTFVLAIIFATRIVNSITYPIERLTASAARLTAGQLDERVQVTSDDEIGQLAATFNQMADELQIQYGELEQRIAERTRALETSLEVSRRLSTILDRVTLAREVVQQVQAAFDYYHVHIYLYDEGRKFLTMVGGTGRAGRTMLARGHRLVAGQGLVGRTAARNEVALVTDVTQDPDWLPNPLLTETKAEVAVPIAYAGEVLGVLDVQHNEVGGLGQDDIHLLLMIASQFAIALQNARLLEQAEARAEHAALINTISQQIQNATSVESVLQIAAQELGRALHTDRAQVELHTPGGRWAPETAVKRAVPGENGDSNGKA